MRAARVGREAQDGGDFVEMRIGARGLARMHGAPVTALHGGYYALLRGHRLAQPLPAGGLLILRPWCAKRALE